MLSDPVLAIVTVAILGLIIGSFLNVVIARLPVMLERQWRAECAELLETPPDPVQAAPASDDGFNLVQPRSRCPGCGRQIAAYDNIPVLSWLILRGRCRHCATRISAQYPVVELLAGVLAVAAVTRFGLGWEGGLTMVFAWVLLAAGTIDLRTTLLPDDLTLPLLWLGLVAAAAGVGHATPVDAILGAAAGYLSLWALYHVFRLLTGKEGMGYGDFKLLAALGAWVGWQGLPLVIILSSLVGALVGIALIALRGRDRSIPIPFGPFLAAGGWIGLHWGDTLTQAYIRWALG